jgi:hypothetical protein
MGSLLTPNGHFDIDDRVLAHVQIVILDKLRRGEPLLITVQHSSSELERSTGVWIGPSVPLVFIIADLNGLVRDRELLARLVQQSHSLDGIVVQGRSRESAIGVRLTARRRRVGRTAGTIEP